MSKNRESTDAHDNIKMGSIEQFAMGENIERNSHGGWYHRGKEYSTEKKIECQEIYYNLSSTHNKPPSIKELASACKVGYKFAKKIIQEIEKKVT